MAAGLCPVGRHHSRKINSDPSGKAACSGVNRFSRFAGRRHGKSSSYRVRGRGFVLRCSLTGVEDSLSTFFSNCQIWWLAAGHDVAAPPPRREASVGGMIMLVHFLQTAKLLQWTYDRTASPKCGAILPIGWPTRCLIPDFDGSSSSESKDALWARFFMGAPRRQRRFVERYSIVKRA